MPRATSSRVPTTRAALACVAVSGALLAGGTVPARAAAPAPPTGWQRVFLDDFDDAAGTSPDPATWNHDIGTGWWNNQLEHDTASTENSAQDGEGNLVITARRDQAGGWTSARLTTKDKLTQKYGRIEARMKVPAGQGMWPAFWMLGADDVADPTWPNGGEIDIMEYVGKEPDRVFGTVHGPGYLGTEGLSGEHVMTTDVADDFHTYSVDWSPEGISWAVDGKTYHEVTPADVAGNPWVFDHEFYLLLNLAVGGDWPGSPDASTPAVNELVVDYVATYRATTEQPTPPPTPEPSAPPVVERNPRSVSDRWTIVERTPQSATGTVTVADRDVAESEPTPAPVAAEEQPERTPWWGGFRGWVRGAWHRG